MKWFRSQKTLPSFLFGPVGFFRCWRGRLKQHLLRMIPYFVTSIAMCHRLCFNFLTIFAWPVKVKAINVEWHVCLRKTSPMRVNLAVTTRSQRVSPYQMQSAQATALCEVLWRPMLPRSVRTNMAFAQFIMSLFVCTWWNQDQTPVNFGFDVPSFGHV